jgi:CubicO group peptidase (beta-lactamase class C family)
MRLARMSLISASLIAVATLLSPAGAPVLASEAVPFNTLTVAPMVDRLGFWSPAEQEFAYRTMERVFPTNKISRGTHVHEFKVAAQPLALEFMYENRPYTADDFMRVNRASAILVVRDGTILLEKYSLGRRPGDRWTSFSIAKSVTSTLLGAAIKDGFIKSVNDPIVKYLPELKGSVYDGVSLQQALTMSSGVEWNEDYQDPKSDFSLHATKMGKPFLATMATKKRVAAPGEKFSYSTGESNVLGAVVQAATKKTLSAYLTEKIWTPYGMEQDGVWMTNNGQETGGICFSATLRDYARFGQFILDGGMIDGKSILPDGWVAEATKNHVKGERLYGYQWWPHEDGSFEGIGIMGQSLLVDPASRTIVVIQSAWPKSGTAELRALQAAFKAAAVSAARGAKL